MTDKVRGGVKYQFKDKKGKLHKLFVDDYNKINKALNEDEIKEIDDLKKFIAVLDENNKKVNNYDNEYVEQCAKYQLGVKFDDGIDGGGTDLENLIVLAYNINDIEALKKIRFEPNQNNFNQHKNTYKDIESFLNQYGLTIYDSQENENKGLTFYGKLLENGTDHICANASTPDGTHAFSVIVDLKKLHQLLSELSKEEIMSRQFDKLGNFIYIYDSIAAVDTDLLVTVKDSFLKDHFLELKLEGVKDNSEVFSHIQQNIDKGSCWFHTCAATTAVAKDKDKRIIEGIREKIILPDQDIEKEKVSLRGVIQERSIGNTKLNDYEILQMAATKRMLEDFEIKNPEKIMGEIFNKETLKKIGETTENYFKSEEKYLNDLESRLDVFEALLVLCQDKNQKINELTPKIKDELLTRAKKVANRKGNRMPMGLLING